MKTLIQKEFEGFTSTPSLFSGDSFENLNLLHLDQARLPTEALTEPDTNTLGKRMEVMFSLYIKNLKPRQEVIVHNIQIICEKRTLGELDFLISDKESGKVLHVELAYKFYLYAPMKRKISLLNIEGPNRRDFLWKKLEKIKKHQFPLLRHPATVDTLAALHLDPERIEQKLCFKANLFVPADSPALPLSVNPQSVQGIWIRSEDFHQDQYKKSSFLLPEKKNWSILPDLDVNWTTWDDILVEVTELLNAQRSPLIWMKTPGGILKRLFVVWW